jgi:hypothetical protein
MNTKFASATTNETNANETIATNARTMTTTNANATATTTNATNVTNATTNTNANANATTNATNVTSETTNEAITTKSFTNVMILVAIDHEHVIMMNDLKKKFVNELSFCESQYVDTKKNRTSHERKIR